MDTRGEVVSRRTYCRPKDDRTTETWIEAVHRVITHQRWLWERELERKLNMDEENELLDLEQVLLTGRGALSGRTMWLGGTLISKIREASQFNCAFLNLKTVHDMVDAFWLLLQGCGVGGHPVPGSLWGFSRQHEIQLRATDGKVGLDKGDEHNYEWDEIEDGKHVHNIEVGDSAEAWAKFLGKLLAFKCAKTDILRLHFDNIRDSGQRLSGYGWICAGRMPLRHASSHICGVLNRASGRLLSFADIHDVLNIVGTVLSSRRSAEIVTCNADGPALLEFMEFKREGPEKPWRYQSNNSVVFNHRPSVLELRGFFATVAANGGSEPGLINGAEARRRAPYYAGPNPCNEILLPDKGFCNLVDINLAHRAHKDRKELIKTGVLLARANYRQTCVNLLDGILQHAWHENNQTIRLCGVGVTGWMQTSIAVADLTALRKAVTQAAHDMAHELKCPMPALVTTIKPSGTMSKVLGCTEGIHAPIGEYIFNTIEFPKDDPCVPVLELAGYTVFGVSYKPDSAFVVFPVKYERCITADKETAADQLGRYLRSMNWWTDHNTSITITYEPDEVEDLVRLIHENWNDIVGLSFMPKMADNGTYEYLPQRVVTKEEYDAYVKTLATVDIQNLRVIHFIDDSECKGGACPTI